MEWLNKLIEWLPTIMSVVTMLVGLVVWGNKMYQRWQESQGDNFWHWTAGEVLKELRRCRPGLADGASLLRSNEASLTPTPWPASRHRFGPAVAEEQLSVSSDGARNSGRRCPFVAALG